MAAEVWKFPIVVLPACHVFISIPRNSWVDKIRFSPNSELIAEMVIFMAFHPYCTFSLCSVTSEVMIIINTFIILREIASDNMRTESLVVRSRNIICLTSCVTSYQISHGGGQVLILVTCNLNKGGDTPRQCLTRSWPKSWPPSQRSRIKCPSDKISYKLQRQSIQDQNFLWWLYYCTVKTN